MQGRILEALLRLDWDALSQEQRILLVRTYEIAFNRFGRPDDPTVERILAQLDPRFPAPARELNWVLCETLAYLESPTVAAKGIALIQQAPTQEEQMEYARSLRMLKTGWTIPLRTAYLQWFLKAANYRGGASFDKFIEFIRNDAVASMSEAEKSALHGPPGTEAGARSRRSRTSPRCLPAGLRTPGRSTSCRPRRRGR